MSTTTATPAAKIATFSVKNGRVHRSTCKRLNGEADALTAREAIETADRLLLSPATCCKPQTAHEWKATSDTISAERETAAANKAAAQRSMDTVEKGLMDALEGRGTAGLAAAVEEVEAAAKPARKSRAKKATPDTDALDEATAKSILATPVSERIAAGLRAGRKHAEQEAAAPAAKKADPAPAATPSAHGDTEAMNGKPVRAGAHTLAYVSRTRTASGKSIVRMEWTLEGHTIVCERGRYTVDGQPVEAKSLTAAADAALAG